METIHAVHFLSISKPQLSDNQEATRSDPVLQSLKNIIANGWPDVKDNLPSELHSYFIFVMS